MLQIGAPQRADEWLAAAIQVVGPAVVECDFRAGYSPGLGEGPALVLLRLGRIGVLVGVQACVDSTEEGSIGGGSQAGGVGVPGATARGVPAGTSTSVPSCVAVFLLFLCSLLFLHDGSATRSWLRASGCPTQAAPCGEPSAHFAVQSLAESSQLPPHHCLAAHTGRPCRPWNRCQQVSTQVGSCGHAAAARQRSLRGAPLQCRPTQPRAAQEGALT